MFHVQKSALKRPVQKCCHNVHSNTLPPPSLTVLAAVHVVPLELVRREEVVEAVDECDVRPVEPAEDPTPRPRRPAGARAGVVHVGWAPLGEEAGVAEVAQALGRRDRQGEVLNVNRAFEKVILRSDVDSNTKDSSKKTV